MPVRLGIVTIAIAALILACGTQPSAPPTPDTASPTASPERPVPPTTSPPEAAVGNEVGNRVPDFDMQLPDGSFVATSDLLAAEKPVFLIFFTTW